MPRDIRGVLFDKDGTLFDFATTWDAWAAQIIEELSLGDRRQARRIAEAMDYDPASGQLRPRSPIIAGTNWEAAELIAAVLPGTNVSQLEAYLAEAASKAPLAPVVPLRPFLGTLRARGIRLGVMTNDSDSSARSHLGSAGVLDHFDFVAGFDSGYGSKPSPEPLLAFAMHVGVAAGQVVMVGDSTHDLLAGRAAGMICVGVLTGPANEKDLLPFADVILTDIGRLLEWLDG